MWSRAVVRKSAVGQVEGSFFHVILCITCICMSSIAFDPVVRFRVCLDLSADGTAAARILADKQEYCVLEHGASLPAVPH